MATLPIASVATATSVSPSAAADAAPPPEPAADAALDASVDADGGTDAAVAASGCPDEMAKIGKACVDRWEGHLVVVGADGSTTPHPHSERPPADGRYEARSAADVFPQAYISRVEAKAACKSAGKRLCSMNEWRRACQGKRWMTYPYGQRSRPGACNTGKVHLLPLYFGNDPRKWKYDEHFNNPLLATVAGFLAKGGEHPQCESGEGVVDMVGNLHEWVSDMVDRSFVERLDRDDVSRNDQSWVEGNGAFLGGFFSTTSELGPGCKFATIAHEPSYHDYSTGFRCCRNVDKPN